MTLKSNASVVNPYGNHLQTISGSANGQQQQQQQLFGQSGERGELAEPHSLGLNKQPELADTYSGRQLAGWNSFGSKRSR